jgi:16S rRNA (uracil1498-N3)-methyltransferase
MDVMDIFYQRDIQNQEVLLDPAESNHCIGVMRYRRGDRIGIIDGKGGYCEAELLNEDRKACRVTIVSRLEKRVPLPYKLHIAIAPTKSIDRFEFFVEKATEMGVASITPIICQRSERRKLRKDRVEKVAIAAMKQSGNGYLPEITEMEKFHQWISRDRSGAKYIAYCVDNKRIHLRDADHKDENWMLIGPEGDFTENEVTEAISHGFQPVSLGPNTLRTETAGILACTSFYIKLHE